MAWTKRQLIEEAYAELALASYSFDLSPEEMQAALRRMDAMMAMWDRKGILVGYALTSDPDASSLDTDSGLPLHAIEPVYMNLAVRLCGAKGKQLSPTTAAKAKEGYDVLMLDASAPREQQLRYGLPAGAGHKTTTRPFLPAPSTDPLQVGEGGGLDFLEP